MARRGHRAQGRRQWPDPDASGDRNGEPSEEDPRWEFPLVWALVGFLAMALLCLFLIMIIAGSFPICRTYEYALN